MKRGSHYNKGMQDDFNKWGEGSFSIRRIEATAVRNRRMAEQRWFEYFSERCYKIYNINRPYSDDRQNRIDYDNGFIVLSRAARLIGCPLYALDILITKGLIHTSLDDQNEPVIATSDIKQARHLTGFYNPRKGWLLRRWLIWKEATAKQGRGIA